MTMKDIKLSSPRLRVTVEDEGGALVQYDVQTSNADMIRFDLLRQRKGWPSMKEAPMLWMTVLAWHALKRSGKAGDDFEAYADRIVELTTIDEDGNEVEGDDASQEAGPLL